MAGFGLPNFGQLTEAFKKAKQIQQDAQKLQDELENMEIEGKSDDEMIKVWISGNQLPLKVEVQESILNANKGQLVILPSYLGHEVWWNGKAPSKSISFDIAYQLPIGDKEYGSYSE